MVEETADPRFVAAGLLVSECGKRYYFHSDPRRGSQDTYYCSSKFPKGPGCGGKRLRRIDVDAAILHIVEKRLLDEKFLVGVFGRLKQAPPPDLGSRERELAKLAARRRKWIDQFDDDRITKKEFAEKMDAVARATAEVEAPPGPPRLCWTPGPSSRVWHRSSPGSGCSPSPNNGRS